MKHPLNKKIEIEFWFEHTDELESLSESELWELESQAMDRIHEMRKEFYVAGELYASIDGKEFYGWWNFKEINK